MVRTEPVVKVTPETPGFLTRGQVLMSGNDDPDFRLARPVITKGKIFALLQQAQQFDLRRLAQIPDLVKKEGAGGSLFDQPAAHRIGTGEGAAHMAKQGVGKDVVIKAGNIDGDQIATAAAQLVHSTGDQFLAGA